MTPEEVKELRDDVQNAEFAPAIKSKILALLDGEVTFEVVRQIGDLMQQDIDSDFDSIDGLVEQYEATPEYQKLVAETDAGIKQVEAEFEQEMNAINEEVEKLEIELSGLEQENTKARLEQLKGKLGTN